MNKLFGSRSSEFEQEVLQAHNEMRRDHGVDSLVLNKDISKKSQKWAEELAKKDVMTHGTNKEYGENINSLWSTDPNVKFSGQDAVERWYNEINDYRFGEEPKPLKSGNFTQIVWKGTKEMGVGSAKSKSGKFYIVVNYSPPGNVFGEFVKNVLPRGAFSFAPLSNSTSSKPAIARQTSPELSKKLARTSLAESPKTDKSDRHSSDKATSFEQECLDYHNLLRKKHGVSPLVLNKKISKFSLEWAIHLVKIGKMVHSENDDYGENLYVSWSSDPNHAITGKEAVQKWYDEIKDFTFGREPSDLRAGHFTQVIWNQSKELGVAQLKANDGKIYVVCNYYPPGNVVGSFSKSVPPPN